MIFASILLSISTCLAAPAPQATALTPELILNHPGFASAEYNRIQADLLSAIEQDPNSVYTASAMDVLLEISHLCDEEIELDRWAALAPKLSDPDASLKARNRLLRELDRRLYRDQKITAPDDLFGDFITNWAVVGPFGTLVAPGSFQAEQPLSYAPAANAPVRRLQSNYVSPWGSPLQWHALSRRANTTKLQPAKLVPGQQGCGYMMAYLKASPQLAEIDFFCDEDCDVFWNGELLLQKRSYLPANNQSRFRLAVQVAEQNILQVRFDASTSPVISARLLKGSRSATTWEAGWDSLQKMLQSAPTDLQTQPLDYPLTSISSVIQHNQWQSNPTLNSAETLLQMHHDYRHGRPDRAMAILKPQDQKWLTTWLRLRHNALEEADYLPAEWIRREQLALEEELLLNGVVDARIEIRKVTRMVQEDQPEQALAIAQQLAQNFPGVAYLDFLAIQALTEFDKSGLMARTFAQEHLQRFPQSIPALRGMYGYANRGHQPLEAIQYLHRALQADGAQNRTFNSLMEELVSSTAEHRTLARALLKKRDQLFPKSSTTQSWRRRLLRERNLTAEIQEEFEQAVTTRPYANGRQTNLVEFYLEHGYHDLAQQQIEKALWQHPGNAQWSATLKLLGTSPAEEQFFQEFAPDRNAALADAAQATDASTALILDSGMYYFYPDGSHRRLTHSIAKALDRKGTEILHEQAASRGTRIARVIQADGQVFEPVLVDGAWVMPSLNPEDLVEIQYASFEEGTPGSIPQVGWWRFASFAEPFVLSRYVVYLPSEMSGEWRQFQFEGSHEIVPWKDGSVHIFTQHLSPRFEEEPMRPSDEEVLPWVQFGADYPLEEMAAYHLWMGAWLESVTADMHAPLRQILQQLPNSSQPRDRAEAIYNWVTEHVQDFDGFENLASIYHNRRGFPIGLIAALLRMDGITVEWAVLHPPTAPQLDTRPANAFRKREDFGEMILRLQFDDATAGSGNADAVGWLALPYGGRGFPFLKVPTELAGATALVFSDLGLREETLPIAPLLDNWDTDLSVSYTLQQDRSAYTTGMVRISSAQGALLREQVLGAEPAQRSQAARQIVGSLVPGINLEKWDFARLDERGAAFELTFEGSIPKFVLGNDGNLGCRLRLQPMELASNFGAVERKWPLAMRIINRLRWQVELHGNDIYDLDYGPTSNLLQRPGFTYNFEVEKNSDAVKVTRFVEISGLWLEPEELAPFLKQASTQEQQEKRAVRLSFRQQ